MDGLRLRSVDIGHSKNPSRFRTSLAPQKTAYEAIPKTVDYGMDTRYSPCVTHKGDVVGKSKRVALYARVSTDSQTTDNQLRELRHVAERHGWTIVAEFVDKGISGVKGRDQRPQFDALSNAISRREFDMVAAWSVDRLGRSLQDLVLFLNELHAKKVDLFLHHQGLDTSTPAGRMMFQMMGVFAEFERAMIVDRVKAGLARAKAHGTRSGKPLGRPKAPPEMEQRIRDLYGAGMGRAKIARTLGVGVSLTSRVLGR